MSVPLPGIGLFILNIFLLTNPIVCSRCHVIAAKRYIYVFLSNSFLPSNNTLLENVEQGFNEIEQTQIYLYGLDISGWSAKHKLPEFILKRRYPLRRIKALGID